MALTPTEQIPLGFKAPDFSLPDTVSKKQLGLKDISGEKATVVMFICNHCPFVVHVREELINLANDYLEKGIGFVAINSNDVENYPADSPEKMAEMAQEFKFPFPYLFDETQEIAKTYHAACTPDFSIFDADMTCVYRGRLDESRPGNGLPVTGNDIRLALDNIIEDKSLTETQYPSMGCNIKWK